MTEVRTVQSPTESECHQCLISAEHFLHSLSLFFDILNDPFAHIPGSSYLPRCQATGVKRSSCNELDTVCLPSLGSYLLLLFLLIDPSLYPYLTGMTHSGHRAIQASTLCDRNSYMPTEVQWHRSTP